jgi:SAM-dependent methyltransferase
MDWHEGYFSGSDYLVEFFPDQGPVHLNAACVLNGVEPLPPDQPFTYFELGCGQGLTASVLAAANPRGRFYAADFVPAQILNAQELADAAGQTNLHLLEKSFAQLAAGEVDLPPMDYITLHGVYSWVRPEQRVFIDRFIERYLKPGGIVYVSYNAMPGWTCALPLQRLLVEHAGRQGGTQEQKLGRAKELILRMTEAQAQYFTQDVTPALRHSLESIRDFDVNPQKFWSTYLTHEYLSQGWEPLYFADVARALSSAKLDYVGSSEMSSAFAHLYMTPEQEDLLAAIVDPILRETTRDYLQNTKFRRDIYVRGARRMSPARQRAWLDRMGVALTSVRSTIPADIAQPGMLHRLDETLLGAVLETLGEGPAGIADLAALPVMAGRETGALLEVLAVLNQAKHLQFYFIGDKSAARAPVRAMNDALVARGGAGDTYRVFASALTGSGVANMLGPRMVYRALRGGVPATDVETITTQVHEVIAGAGLPIDTAGDGQASPERERAIIRKWVVAIIEGRLPVWRQLDVI